MYYYILVVHLISPVVLVDLLLENVQLLPAHAGDDPVLLAALALLEGALGVALAVARGKVHVLRVRLLLLGPGGGRRILPSLFGQDWKVLAHFSGVVSVNRSLF